MTEHKLSVIQQLKVLDELDKWLERKIEYDNQSPGYLRNDERIHYRKILNAHYGLGQLRRVIDVLTGKREVGEVYTRKIPAAHEILESVADTLNMHVSDFWTKTRVRPVVDMRGIAAIFLQRNCNMSLSQIGEQYGGQDHTTVLSLIRRTQRLLEDGNLAFSEKFLQCEINLQKALENSQEKAMNNQVNVVN